MTGTAPKPQWIAVHCSRLAEFANIYGDGSEARFMGEPMTGVPLVSHEGLDTRTIRVHTASRDFDIPYFGEPWELRPEATRWVRADGVL